VRSEPVIEDATEKVVGEKIDDGTGDRYHRGHCSDNPLPGALFRLHVSLELLGEFFDCAQPLECGGESDVMLADAPIGFSCLLLDLFEGSDNDLVLLEHDAILIEQIAFDGIRGYLGGNNFRNGRCEMSAQGGHSYSGDGAERNSRGIGVVETCIRQRETRSKKSSKLRG